MTKEDILDYFKDINDMYNNPNMLDDLSHMLDKLLKEQQEEITRYRLLIISMPNWLDEKRPEVVRCKNCKYVECEGVEGFLVCDLSGFSHSPDFYCADGERK